MYPPDTRRWPARTFLPTSITKKARRNGLRRRRPDFESLEDRTVPTTASLSTVADGLVADRNLDGTFETAVTYGTTVTDRWFSDPTIGQERDVFEFDLSRITAGTPILSATLNLDVISYTSSSLNGVVTNPQVLFNAAAGTGTVTTADGASAATAAGTGTVAALGSQQFTLTPSALQALEGGYLSLRMQNTALNANWVQVDSVNNKALPPATLTLVLASPATPSLSVSLASHTIAGNAGMAATTGTVTRTGTDLKMPITVTLSSSMPSLATVPATVVIPAGQSSATFNVSTVGNGPTIGSQAVIVSANAVDSVPLTYNSGFGTLGVTFGENTETVQPDGKIVVAGFSTARLNVDGTLDPTYTVTPTGFGTAVFVAVQADGKIVSSAGGYSNSLVRFNANGGVDTSFGTNGVVTINSYNTEFYSIAFQSDGKILAGGSFNFNGSNGPYVYGVARFNTNGTLDTTYGANGYALTDFQYPSEEGFGMAIQADGKAVLVGSSPGGDSPASRFALARFTTGGQLDSTFGTGGEVLSAMPGSGGLARAIVIQPDGKIVVFGFNSTGIKGASTDQGLLARFTVSGTLDPTFGNGGVVIEDQVLPEIGPTLALQPDGRIVVAGQSFEVGPAVVARFLPDGTYDSDLVEIPVNGETSEDDSIAVSPGGTIYTTTTFTSTSYPYGFISHQLQSILGSASLSGSDTLTVTPATFPAPTAINDSYTVSAGGTLVTAGGVPAPGALLRYGFDEATSGAGTAQDSGQSLAAPGTFTGTATRTANTPGGVSAGALDLSAAGGNSYVNAGDVSKLDNLSSLTLTAWINLRAVPQAGDVLMSDDFALGAPAGLAGWELRIAQPFDNSQPISASNFALSFGVSESAGSFLNTQAQASSSFSANGQWVFVAVTFTSGGLLTYYTGSPGSAITQLGVQALFNNKLGTDSAPFEIGATGSQPSVNLTPPAWLDDVNVYGSALSAAQVDAIRTEDLGTGVLANDLDPSGDPLTAALVAGPAHGALTLNSDGSFSYTPAPGFVGSDSFTYQAIDGAFKSSPATASITVFGPPVASPDSYTTAQNTPLTTVAPGLLANDTDPNGLPLTASLVAGPAHGGVTLNGDGSFTYTPTAGYAGPDSFTYRDSDTDGPGNTATVSLFVGACTDPPVRRHAMPPTRTRP